MPGRERGAGVGEGEGEEGGRSRNGQISKGKVDRMILTWDNTALRMPTGFWQCLHDMHQSSMPNSSLAEDDDVSWPFGGWMSARERGGRSLGFLDDEGAAIA